MKPYFFIFSVFISSCTIAQKGNEIVKGKHEGFKLWYSYAGLGSGFGSMQPVFRVVDNKFLYTEEQNSFYNDIPRQNPDTICKGTLRESSIDSILMLVKDIKDSLIYKTNVYTTSGGVHEINIRYNSIHITFTLHNAYDSTCEKIVDILNSNVPVEFKRLWINNFDDAE